MVKVRHLLPEGKVLHERRAPAARPETPLLRKAPADVRRHVVIGAVDDVMRLHVGARRVVVMVVAPALQLAGGKGALR